MINVVITDSINIFSLDPCQGKCKPGKLCVAHKFILGDSGGPILQWKGHYWEQVRFFILRSINFQLHVLGRYNKLWGRM
jgi:hypothetical protein